MTESSESITAPDFLSFSEILFYWLRSVIMLRICSHFFSIAPGFVANITVKNMLINRETELKTHFRLLQCRIDKFLAVIRFKIFFAFWFLRIGINIWINSSKYITHFFHCLKQETVFDLKAKVFVSDFLRWKSFQMRQC